MTVVFKFKTEMRHNSQAQQELSKGCTFRIGQVDVKVSDSDSTSIKSIFLSRNVLKYQSYK